MPTNSPHPTDSASRIELIAQELELPARQLQAAIALLQGGNTVPFIARYRKEATGGLDEIALRAIEEAWEKAEVLAQRKKTVLKSITEQGQLTDALQEEISACRDLQSLELLYLPFKPKRRTRAEAARERGLQPLADILLAQQACPPSQQLVERFIASEKGLADREAVLQGALDIVAEQWAEHPDHRRWLIDLMQQHGRLTSKLKRGKRDEANRFQSYHDYSEPLRKAPSHRVLAMLRGAAEGVLRVEVALDDSRTLGQLKSRLLINPRFEFAGQLERTVEDCYQRLLLPGTQSAVMQQLKERADEEAINVFGKNLRELLLAAPAGPKVTLGIDPGFRTGCKCAVVDGTGRFLEHATLYPTPPRSETTTAKQKLLELIRKHRVELIAIGNGTASRETDQFVGEVVREEGLKLTYVLVSEAGASVYSASQLAAEEFPRLDLTVRGAISIARRLQDPLSELVKTDPKSIGVGQYQHDVNQAKLRKCLDRVVESCVNHVGVDVNSASVSLLTHVSGIGPRLAENIVAYRNLHGRFRHRQQLTEVPKLGNKAFEQAAGFLRIRDGEQPLDNSAVHPESYSVVARMAGSLQVETCRLIGNPALSQKLRADEFVDQRHGLPTIRDILMELSKPGRDPRATFRAPRFDQSVQSIEDLKRNMVLEGVVTNVTHFGAFVDIGVHQDGLIHVSQLADSYVSDPNKVVAVGDVVKVKVLEIDAERKRISISRKL